MMHRARNHGPSFIIVIALSFVCACETRLPLPIAPTRGAGSDPSGNTSGYTLSGFVEAMIDSRVVSVDGATVHVVAGPESETPDGPRVRTNSDGWYRIDGLTAGLVSIEVAHEDYKTITSSVMLPLGTPQLNHVLIPAEHVIQRINLGETVRSSVSPNDPYCAALPPIFLEDHPKNPCKTFAITSPQTGTLIVDLVWPSGSNSLQLLIPWLGATHCCCCQSPQRWHFAVVRGLTYTFSVGGFESSTGARPTGTVPFDLLTSVGPCQLTYWNWDCSTGRE